MSCRKACLLVLVISPTLVISATFALAQVSHPEQVQIAPPLVRGVDPPAQDATAADLEQQGDRLRADKLYLDALDYAAIGNVRGSNGSTTLVAGYQNQWQPRIL